MNFDLSDAAISVRNMVRKRGWERYQRPLRLVSALSLEAHELLAEVQWMTDAEIESNAADSQSAIVKEVADVALNLILLAQALNIDLPSVVNQKALFIVEEYKNRRIPHSFNKHALRCTQCSANLKYYWAFCPDCGEGVMSSAKD